MIASNGERLTSELLSDAELELVMAHREKARKALEKSLKAAGIPKSNKPSDSLGFEYEMPLSLACKKFLDAWNDWCLHRKQRKPKLTPLSVDRQLKKCAEMGVERAVAMIEHSIAGSFQGLYEDRGKKHPVNFRHKQEIQSNEVVV